MKMKLMIVDDDPSLGSNLKRFFERQQYEVQTAQDGPSALNLHAAYRPHLVFLDIGLPGMSGVDVLQELKKRDPSVRVIMITGQAERELMRQTKSMGADDYVTKPFTLEYLTNDVLTKLHNQLFDELRSTSQHLALEREKVELLFNAMTEGVLLLDQQGTVFLANPAAQKMLGLEEHGDPTSILQAFRTFKSNPPNRLDHLEAEQGLPFDLIRESPRYFAVEARVSPIVGRRQERYGYFVLFHDVTLERKADTAMHRFVSIISHKLRTPLVTIRAYPKLLLQSNDPLTEIQRKGLETIQRQCHVLETMVNQLIAFSSLDPEELMRQDISLGELVENALKLGTDEIQKQALNVKRGENLHGLQAHVDPTLMQHAVQNLVDNAFKFGAKHLDIQGKRQNGSVVLEFKDDGPGIPPEDRERVFERFYQVEKAFSGQVPGAGLGLTMVKQVVEAHGGSVWIESVLDRGTSVFVRLPISAS